jgi:hypothetical protein
MMWNFDNNSFPPPKGAADGMGQAINSLDKVTRLEISIDRLLLINRALWEIIQERFQLTEEILKDKVSEIDLRDGKLDGRLKKGVKKCDRCNRMLNPRHKTCIFCGYPVQDVDVFDEVK